MSITTWPDYMPLELMPTFGDIVWNGNTSTKCCGCEEHVRLAVLKVFDPWKYLTGAQKKGALELTRQYSMVKPNGRFYYEYSFCPVCHYIYSIGNAKFDWNDRMITKQLVKNPLK